MTLQADTQDNIQNTITTYAHNHYSNKFNWHDRGASPTGYIPGTCLVYARVYLRSILGSDDVFTLLSQPLHSPTQSTAADALAYYAPTFKSRGITLSPGLPMVRATFTLLAGLGMAESSGNPYCGRDTTAGNTISDRAEAGLYQTSWNAGMASPLLPKIFQTYEPYPSFGFLEVFKQGVPHPTAANLKNWGNDPTGLLFQNLSKICPAFAAEFAAVTLRVLRGHYGTINRHLAEIDPALMPLFEGVEKIVSTAYTSDPAATKVALLLPSEIPAEAGGRNSLL